MKELDGDEMVSGLELGNKFRFADVEVKEISIFGGPNVSGEQNSGVLLVVTDMPIKAFVSIDDATLHRVSRALKVGDTITLSGDIGDERFNVTGLDVDQVMPLLPTIS